MPHDSHYGQRTLGDLVPKLAELTDQTLFADIWQWLGLTPRARSLATASTLIALNRVEQLPFHFGRAYDNGIDRATLAEWITHLAFCAAPAVSALRNLDEVNKP